jgi:hypothetical protein
MFTVFSCITGKNTVLQLSLVTPEMPRTAAVLDGGTSPENFESTPVHDYFLCMYQYVVYFMYVM